MDEFSFQSLMDQYFGRMRSLTSSKELPARIRFLLQNTVELRANNWTPRKAHIDSGPKTIGQVRQEAVKVSPLGARRRCTPANMNSYSDHLLQDLGIFIPPQNDAMRNDFFMDNTSFLQSKMKFDRETFGGLADMFGQMPGRFWTRPATFLRFQQVDVAECPLTLLSRKDVE